MQKASVSPMSGRILVKRLPKAKTTGIIILPDSMEVEGAYLAQVLKVGPPRVLSSGKLEHISVLPGQVVLVSAISGYRLEGFLERKLGDGLTFIFETDIHAVVDVANPYMVVTSADISRILETCGVPADIRSAKVQELFPETTSVS